MIKSLSNIVNAINLLTKALKCVRVVPVIVECCYYISGIVATTITVAGTYYKILGTTSEGCSMDGCTHSNNRLTYTGDDEAVFTYIASGSFICNTNNTIVTFAPAVNGVAIPSASIDHKIGTGADVVAAAVAGRITLTKDDYFEMFMTCDQAGAVVTLNKMIVLLN